MEIIIISAVEMFGIIDWAELFKAGLDNPGSVRELNSDLKA